VGYVIASGSACD